MSRAGPIKNKSLFCSVHLKRDEECHMDSRTLWPQSMVNSCPKFPIEGVPFPPFFSDATQKTNSCDSYLNAGLWHRSPGTFSRGKFMIEDLAQCDFALLSQRLTAQVPSSVCLSWHICWHKPTLMAACALGANLVPREVAGTQWDSFPFFKRIHLWIKC